MIDEKKLIELLEDEILRIDTESTPGCGNLYGRDASVMKNTLNFVIDLINEQPKVNKWIPVKDRLPEDNQAVLTCKNKHISILIWKSERRIWLEPKGNWWWSYCMVEKWQPLPEPFKGETE